MRASFPSCVPLTFVLSLYPGLSATFQAVDVLGPPDPMLAYPSCSILHVPSPSDLIYVFCLFPDRCFTEPAFQT